MMILRPGILSCVEKFAGISGNKDGIDNLPDGEFLPPWEFNFAEIDMRQKVNAHYPNRRMMMGRCANQTQAGEPPVATGTRTMPGKKSLQPWLPLYGGYFSSNSSTLPWAENTGNMTLRPDSVVHSILYDEKKERATGVQVIGYKNKTGNRIFCPCNFC